MTIEKNLKNIFTVAVGCMLFAGIAFCADGLTAGKPCDLTPGIEKANQRWPSVAAGKDNYLVVWQDGEAVMGGESDVYAARVSADGAVLDGKGIAVCKVKGFQIYPTVAFDGSNFLVAWSDFRNGQDWDVYAARISPDGKVLDPDGFAIAAGPGNQAYVTAASDGKGTVLLAWSDLRPKPDKPKEEVYALFGTLVKEGKPAESGGHELARAASSILAPVGVWDGQNYLVIAGKGGGGWQFSDSFAVSVTPDGKAAPVKLSFAYTYSVAADPVAKKVLLWHNDRKEHGSYCCFYYSTLVAENKAAGGARVFGFQPQYAPANDMWCATAWDGKNFVGVVEQYEQGGKNDAAPSRVELAATRVNPADGKPLDLAFWDKTEKPPDAEVRKFNAEKKPVVVASENGIQLRHPAMSSCGGGKSLLVYSRHGGVDTFKINAVLLSE